MNKIFAVFFLLSFFLGLNLEAAVERRSLDLKLPSQQMIERQLISAPGGSSTNGILSASAGATSAAAATVSSFAGQPDVPRNLVITPGGTTGDIESCVITVSGTSITGSSISEDFTFSANQSTAVTGNKAFKTVTSVAFPANCESGGFAATWSIGVGFKLGLRKCMRNAANFLHASYNGVYESTRPTIAASASAVESNTATLNTTLAGSDVELFYFQNYACSP